VSRRKHDHAPEVRRLAREGRAVHCGEPREERGVGA
jgi:hypothetical protein